MEEGGNLTFKVPPHGIEFTLPSPKIGVESLPVVDPPWMPHFKPNVEEVTLNQIQSVSTKHLFLLVVVLDTNIYIFLYLILFLYLFFSGHSSQLTEPGESCKQKW